MKIFLSHSGDVSRNIASIFAQYIPLIIPTVDVFFSEIDIPSGEWFNKLNSEIKESKIGILFATNESINSKWVNFELGGLMFQEKPILILLIDIISSSLPDPLKRLQAFTLDKNGINKTFIEINKKIENRIKERTVEILFERLWDEMELKIFQITNPKGIKISYPDNKSGNKDIDAIKKALSQIQIQISQMFTPMSEGEVKSKHLNELLLPKTSKSEEAKYIAKSMEFEKKVVSKLKTVFSVNNIEAVRNNIKIPDTSAQIDATLEFASQLYIIEIKGSTSTRIIADRAPRKLERFCKEFHAAYPNITKKIIPLLIIPNDIHPADEERIRRKHIKFIKFNSGKNEFLNDDSYKDLLANINSSDIGVYTDND